MGTYNPTRGSTGKARLGDARYRFLVTCHNFKPWLPGDTSAPKWWDRSNYGYLDLICRRRIMCTLPTLEAAQQRAEDMVGRSQLVEIQDDVGEVETIVISKSNRNWRPYSQRMSPGKK
mgnify:CR=1 FL=1